MSAPRPAPPEGYASWLDCVLAPEVGVWTSSPTLRDHARAELAELRKERDELRAKLTELCNAMLGYWDAVVNKTTNQEETKS